MSVIKLLPASFRERHRFLWHKIQDSLDHGRRAFHQRPLPRNKDGRVYIHLGCGPVDHPLFINVDTMGRSHIDYVNRVESLPMFPEGYADLIYCSHCLEHIPMNKTREVLAEWRRILKVGGILRLAVPNFDAIIDIYNANQGNIGAVEAFLMGGQTYAANFHYAVFNESSLREHLEAVGFRNVSRWKHEDYPETAVEDCSTMMIATPKGERLISLNLQAVK